MDIFMMSENKSYRVEYHFPRKCRSTNKKKDGRFANKNKTVSISALKSAALKKKANKQTRNQTNNSLKNSRKYNKEQIGSFGFGHTGI